MMRSRALSTGSPGRRGRWASGSPVCPFHCRPEIPGSVGGRRPTVPVAKGGTGKSVIAINLMADLAARGYNAHYATGSRAVSRRRRCGTHVAFDGRATGRSSSIRETPILPDDSAQ
jgi:hypothetical protein